MSIDIKTQVIKTKKPYLSSLICLIVVIVITAGVTVGNNILDSDIDDLNADINKNNSSVEALKASSNLLQVSHLYKQNKLLLTKLELRSDIVKYIEHIVDISRIYNVSMTGFAYSWDKVDVTVLSRSGIGGQVAYKNVVKLLGEYSSWPSALFDLGYITSFAGHDSMKFGVSLFVK